MSVSYNSGVILGVLLCEICDVELKSNKFEVHDRKGNPTGEFDYEKIWFVTYKGLTTPMTHLYIDSIGEEILELKEPFEIRDLNDYNNIVPEKAVIGIVLYELGYKEYSSLKEVDDIEEKRKLFIDNFGIEPKLYYYFKTW